MSWSAKWLHQVDKLAVIRRSTPAGYRSKPKLYKYLQIIERGVLCPCGTSIPKNPPSSLRLSYYRTYFTGFS